MGVFLQVAVALSCDIEQVMGQIHGLPGELLESWDFSMEACSWTMQNGSAVMVFESSAYEDLAEKLSEKIGGVVMLLYIYDSDFWGYYLYDKGREADRFCPLPDYFSEATEEERQAQAGNAAVVANYFNIKEQDIRNYLVQWPHGADLETFAYPDDKFSREEWQLADFMGRLGYMLSETEEDGKELDPEAAALNAEEIRRQEAAKEALEGLRWLQMQYKIGLPQSYRRYFEERAANLACGEGDCLRLLDPPEMAAGFERLREELLQLERRFPEDRKLMPFALDQDRNDLLFDFGPEEGAPGVVCCRRNEMSFVRVSRSFEDFVVICLGELLLAGETGLCSSRGYLSAVEYLPQEYQALFTNAEHPDPLAVRSVLDRLICAEPWDYNRPFDPGPALETLVKVRTAESGVIKERPMEEWPMEHSSWTNLLKLMQQTLESQRSGLELTFQMQGEGIYIKRLKKTVYKPFFRTVVLYHIGDQTVCLCFDDEKSTCYLLLSNHYVYSHVSSDLVRNLPVGGGTFPEYVVHWDPKLALMEMPRLLSTIHKPGFVLDRHSVWATFLCYPNFKQYFQLQKNWGLEQVFQREDEDGISED